MSHDEKQLVASDSRMASQPMTSCSVPEDFLLNLTKNLLFKGWALCYNTERVCVEAGNVLILISSNCQIDFEVNGKKVPGNIYIWRSFPRSFDPTQENCVESLIEILETVKQQWRVCKCHTMAELTRECEKLQRNPPIDHGHHSLSSSRCQILVKKEVCDSCKIMLNFRAKKLKSRSLLSPHTNLDSTKNARKKLHLEKRKLARLRSKLAALIDSRGTLLAENDSVSFMDILSLSMGDESLQKMTKEEIDLTQLFFEEQIKVAKVKSTNGHLWHPLLLKWCLFLKTKSTSTYSGLGKVITLSPEKILYEIQGDGHNLPGFQDEVTKSIVQEFVEAGPEKHTRYCSLLFDEMKIKEGLVYKTSSDELVGFMHVSDVDQLLQEILHEASGAPAEEELPSHALQIMVRGITTDIWSTFAYFTTKSLQASDLFNIILEGVEILEGNGIKVLAFVSDGAAVNRAFYRILACKNKNWCAINPYDLKRKIFFVCDPPHLLKTTRNCFSNSGYHKKSRLMWRNGKHIDWRHINRAYQEDLSNGIRTLTSITDEHINLNLCSLMKVKLAAQVLSRRMGLALRALKSDDLEETIIFVETFNKWFDIMNVRSLTEGHTSLNNEKMPFVSPDDCRLKWLEEDFVNYLDDWAKQVAMRPGNFTKAERGMMQLSNEAIINLKITCHSVVGITKFMLAEGAPFVLPGKFSQGPWEFEFCKEKGKEGQTEGTGDCKAEAPLYQPSATTFGDSTTTKSCQ